MTIEPLAGWSGWPHCPVDDVLLTRSGTTEMYDCRTADGGCGRGYLSPHRRKPQPRVGETK